MLTRQANTAQKIEEPRLAYTEWLSDCCGLRCYTGFDSRDGYIKAYCPCGKLCAPSRDTFGLIFP